MALILSNCWIQVYFISLHWPSDIEFLSFYHHLFPFPLYKIIFDKNSLIEGLNTIVVDYSLFGKYNVVFVPSHAIHWNIFHQKLVK